MKGKNMAYWAEMRPKLGRISRCRKSSITCVLTKQNFSHIMKMKVEILLTGVYLSPK